MAKRYTHEELQRDEVAESLKETAEAVKSHLRLIIGILIVIGIGLIVFWAIQTHRSGIQREINQQWTDAVEQYSRLIMAENISERQQIGESLIADLELMVETWPEHDLGETAQYLLAKTNYELDRYTDAQESYEAYLEMADTPTERAMGEIGLAYAFENESFFVSPEVQASKIDTAMTHYRSAAQRVPGSYLHYYALMGQARLHELRNENEEAIALYEQVINERDVPTTLGATDPEEGEGEEDQLLSLVRDQLQNVQSQISFQATAQLRLERLRARAGLDMGEVETVEAEAAATTPTQTSETP